MHVFSLNKKNICYCYLNSVFVCHVQGFQLLGELPAFIDSQKKPGSLTEFVTAQKDKLKNMCIKEKDQLMHHPEKNLCKYELGHVNLLFFSGLVGLL